MKFCNMQAVNQIVDTVPIPRMFRVSQHFDAPKLSTDAIGDTLHDGLHIPDITCRITPGMSVAITAGSRMIANYPLILRTLVEFVREQGGNPFIVPSMGSHGGATAQGQKNMLATLGVTEASIGCPIHSSMETVCIGKNSDGTDVHIDRFAYEADGIIVCNRIKPHNGFRAQYESGLFKMMAVGLGKQHGAEAVHASGGAGRSIPLFARVILEKANILFGVGIIENAYDETAEIHVIRSEDIPAQEPIYL